MRPAVLIVVSLSCMLPTPGWASPRGKRSKEPAKPTLSDAELTEIRKLMGRALKGRHEYKRGEALSKLAAMGEKAEMAIPTIKNALKDKVQNVRLSAVFALGAVGKNSKDAVKTLQKVLSKDKDIDMRTAAARGLGTIGPNAAVAVPVLTKSLTSNDADLRRDAAEALGTVCEGKLKEKVLKAALQGMKKLLADPEQSVQTEAAIALGRLKALPQAGVKVLATALQNSKQLLARRLSAALALQSLGPEAASAVSALSKALRERFKRRPGVPYEDQRRQQFTAFRVVLIQTLQAIGPQAKDGLSTLRQVAEEGGDAGDAAEAAIAAIEGSPTEDGASRDDS